LYHSTSHSKNPLVEMFTSLRSRLWLSYALVITVALMVVSSVLLVYLFRNPVLSRQTQQQLNTLTAQITAAPQAFLRDPQAVNDLLQGTASRVLVFNAARVVVFDSQPDAGALSFPRRNLLNRTARTMLDSNGETWLVSASKLTDGRTLVVAAPRPRVPVLGIFADEFLAPILQGGLIAFSLALILAYGLSRWVADPLQAVIQAARGYPATTAQPVPPQGPHEVQDLTRAFNSMVKRVESAQRSQRDFVANVSHELKTPLTSIQGFAQALLDDTAQTPAARRQAAQIIYTESARMHRMALDLLDLARLEGGTADLHMSTVEVGALLRGIVDKFTPLADQAGVALQFSLADDAPASLSADGDRLAQVFTNLVDNALKFTPAGGRVMLAAKKVGSEIELSVTDTGLGVGAEALPHLFDRFYQADASRSRAGGESHGAGLGLSIVKEIVQAHGGKIGVRSQVGQGTVFTIHLPLAPK
jgi:two-component system, OmpR family, sensor kinase